MKRKMRRGLGLLLAAVLVITSPVLPSAAQSDADIPVDALTAPEDEAAKDMSGGNAAKEENAGQEEQNTKDNTADQGNPGTDADADADTSVGTDKNQEKDEAKGEQNKEEEKAWDTPKDTEKPKDVSGKVTVEGEKDVTGTVTVEQDKNDDQVEIKSSDKPYLALGADLSPQQRATVLSLMGVEESQLDSYDVVTVTNAEEHQYLDSYISSGKIGTRALSSVVIVKREKGNGINISTNNISYCTVGMYKNALATAGIEDADIIVAGPTAISGTAALVGVFKAYKEMTGEEVEQANVDAALHEIVVTGQLESSTGSDADEVEGMIAYIKQEVVRQDLDTEEGILKAIEKGSEKFEVTLTEEEKEQLVSLLLKISDLDLDLDTLLSQAQSIYDKISGMEGGVSGFFSKFGDFFGGIFDKISEFFSSLF